MQYPILLMLEGSSPGTPFTSEDLRALEASAALPDWRETDFYTLYQRALRHFEAAGHSQPTQAAYMLAVASVANEPAYLLFKRAEASEAVLSPAELRRLGEALWRIGSRMAEESTLLERMLGTRLMLDGARLVGDEARSQQASALREKGAAAMKAMSRAALLRWPLHSTREAFKEAMLRDELECMLRFVPLAPPAGKAP